VIDRQPARDQQADDPGRHPPVQGGEVVPVVDRFRRNVRDQVLRYPVHGAGQGVQVGPGVTMVAAVHGEPPPGQRREGGVQGIERVPELAPRIGHNHMLGAGRRQPTVP
jgi:hypothetical protein